MKKTVLAFAVLIVAGIIIVVVLSWLSWQPQPWYAPAQSTNPETAKLAERAEYRLNEEFHKIRPSEDTWRIRVTEEVANAWLSSRLEGWLTHDQDISLPPELHGPQLHITVDGIWIAAMVNIQKSEPRPIAVELRVWIDEGIAFVEPTSIRLGRIPLPLSIFEQVMEDFQNQTHGIEAVAPLMDDREVHILNIELENGGVVLTCQTHLPK